MSYVSALENERQFGRYKTRIIIGLFLIIALIAIGWARAPEDITLHYPPDLREGAVMQIGEVDPASIYLFAQYILQQINSWGHDGATDYPKRVSALRYYLTPGYKQFLEEDIKARKSAGELSGRVRTMTFLGGGQYRDDFVQIDGDGWIAWFDVHIREYIGGEPVKDVVLRYPVRVVPYDIDRERNPWQLALDGSGRFQPMRVVTRVEVKK